MPVAQSLHQVFTLNELAKLREQLDELQEENRQLKEEIGLIDQLPDYRKLRLIGMSDTCFRIFALLERRSIVSKDALLRALWNEDEPENALSALGVYLNRLRKILNGFEIKITNVRAVGWYLDDDSRAKAANLMKELTQ